MKASITEKWAIWMYHDVWGNENDGWTVNDKMHITDIAMNIKSKEDVLAALKQVHLLKQEVTADMIEIPSGIGYVIEVDQTEDGRPIFKLEYLGSFFPQAFHKEKNVVLDERNGNIASFRINGDIEIEVATIHKDRDGREYFVCGPDIFYIDEFEKLERTGWRVYTYENNVKKFSVFNTEEEAVAYGKANFDVYWLEEIKERE